MYPTYIINRFQADLITFCDTNDNKYSSAVLLQFMLEYEISNMSESCSLAAWFCTILITHAHIFLLILLNYMPVLFWVTFVICEIYVTMCEVAFFAVYQLENCQRRAIPTLILYLPGITQSIMFWPRSSKGVDTL